MLNISKTTIQADVDEILGLALSEANICNKCEREANDYEVINIATLETIYKNVETKFDTVFDIAYFIIVKCKCGEYHRVHLKYDATEKMDYVRIARIVKLPQEQIEARNKLELKNAIIKIDTENYYIAIERINEDEKTKNVKYSVIKKIQIDDEIVE